MRQATLWRAFHSTLLFSRFLRVVSVAILYLGPENNQFWTHRATFLFQTSDDAALLYFSFVFRIRFSFALENIPKKVDEKRNVLLISTLSRAYIVKKYCFVHGGMMAVKLTKRKAPKINTLNAWAVPLYHCMKLVITKH